MIRLAPRTIVLITIGVLVLAAFGTYFLLNINPQSRASQAGIIDVSNLSEESLIEKDSTTTDISLYSEEGALYEARSEDEAAILEFLQKDPKYNPDEIPTDENVQGVSSVNAQESTPQSLIPKDFIKNSYLARKTKDEDDQFLKDRDIDLNGQHYFYQQKVKGLPVYGGILAIHLRNKKEIYAVDGSLTTTQTTDTTSISEDVAKNKALTVAQEDTNAPLKVDRVEKIIFNEKVLGFSENDVNNVVLAVVVNSEDKAAPFAKRYFIDLSNGNIVYVESLIHTALYRQIYNCAGGTINCPLARVEGQGPTGDSDINNTYNFFGDTYNHFFNTHGRNSYDNLGAPIVGLVNLSTQPGAWCPNAFWDGSQEYMGLCDGVVGNDVVAHELTHAVTQFSAGLVYNRQSGALNESVSDIFAWAIDSSDWNIGEDTTLGIIRKLDDPPAVVNAQPDRLFSTHYYCGAGDDGGVHRNSGVMNKAFYLMTVGGNFNGCTVTGISKTKSLPIIYRALTTYLTSSANFHDMYVKVIQSCYELYPSEATTTCEQVRSALQATEMNQQPVGTQMGPSCSGIARVTPQCAVPTSTPIPTSTPVPPTPTRTPTPLPTVTPIPTNTPSPTATPIPTNTPTPTPTATPFPTATNTPTPIPSATATPTPVCLPSQGDTNCDGVINSADFSYWLAVFNGQTGLDNTKADFNSDGRVTLVDFEILRRSVQL